MNVKWFPNTYPHGTRHPRTHNIYFFTVIWNYQYSTATVKVWRLQPKNTKQCSTCRLLYQCGIYKGVLCASSMPYKGRESRYRSESIHPADESIRAWQSDVDKLRLEELYSWQIEATSIYAWPSLHGSELICGGRHGYAGSAMAWTTAVT